jgi:hypothetical protein
MRYRLYWMPPLLATALAVGAPADAVADEG